MRRVTAPTAEPLTIEEAARQIQAAVGSDSAYITALIQVARDVTEGATGVVLMPSTWRASTRAWPLNGVLPLAIGPISSITSVKYYASGDEALTTLSSAHYTLSVETAPASLIFLEDFEFPLLEDRPDAVQITFVAGHSSASLISPGLKHALRILVRHFYDNPTAEAMGSVHALPIHLRHLLESNRIAGWCA